MTEETKMEVESEAATVEKKNKNVTPSASGESAAQYPDMELAQTIHRATLLANGKLDADSTELLPSDLASKVLTKVTEIHNPSLYQHLAPLLKWTPLTPTELETMNSKNASDVKGLEAKVAEAQENAGDMEVLDGRFAVAVFMAKSGTKEDALAAYQKVVDLPKLSSGKRMDALMEQSRIASFYGDISMNKNYVKEIAKLADESGDWDRRNRLKVYNALCKMLSRDVKLAASLLIDGIATFSCMEMCTYSEFILYTILSNILYLPRTRIKELIIDGPEILSVKDDISVQQAFTLVSALYDCDYKAYLHAMVEMENVLLADRFLQPHCGYIMRELHVLGYKQFLDSYKTVTLESMAKSFGVSVEFLDGQLSRFIAAGRLTAKIDKFGGVVETNRPDLKNAQYRDMIQQGDLLLNRIQKLARVVDV